MFGPAIEEFVMNLYRKITKKVNMHYNMHKYLYMYKWNYCNMYTKLYLIMWICHIFMYWYMFYNTTLHYSLRRKLNQLLFHRYVELAWTPWWITLRLISKSLLDINCDIFIWLCVFSSADVLLIIFIILIHFSATCALERGDMWWWENSKNLYSICDLIIWKWFYR